MRLLAVNKWELCSSSHSGWCQLKSPIQIILAGLIIRACRAFSAKVLQIVWRVFKWSPLLYILKMEMGPVGVLMVISTISWELMAICCQELVRIHLLMNVAACVLLSGLRVAEGTTFGWLRCYLGSQCMVLERRRCCKCWGRRS